MIRRTFVKEAAIAAAAASGLTAGLGSLSGLLAQPGFAGSGVRRLRIQGQTRPFNMVCLGDSVMWGQGLKDSSKFTARVESWLQGKLGDRPVNRFVYARSGATITTDPLFDESKIAAWMNDPTLGEVPCSWPYINRQVAVARDRLSAKGISPNAVDLVLLDGGINDMGVTSLLNPAKTAAEIRQKSTELFIGSASPMADLLNRVRAAFPDARIVVTGYFPVVSDQSNLWNLSLLMAVLAAPPLLPMPVPPTVTVAITAELRSKFVELSNAWYEASNTDIAAAVAAFNSRAAGTRSRASFARIPWGPEHGYAAPDSRLWLIGLPEDEVYFERRGACQAAGGGKIADFRCLEAKMGHPNPAGAAAYAAACQTQLAPYLAEWQGLKQMAACVEMDPMPRPGVPTSLTVYATADGPTGRMRVPGTVRIGGQTYRTEQPVPVTLCSASRQISVDRSGTRPVREAGARVVSCEPITVSASGYVDVVVRDYLKAYALP